MAIDTTGKAAGAIAAYSNTAKIADIEGMVGDKPDSISFGDVLKSGIQKAIDSQKASEKVSADAVIGKADLTDVVSALNEAETTLQMVVAVRDRLVSAYQEIMRMPI